MILYIILYSSDGVGYDQLEYLAPLSQTPAVVENNNLEEDRQMTVPTSSTMSSLPLQLAGSWSLPATNPSQLSPFLQENMPMSSKPQVAELSKQEEQGDVRLSVQ